MKKLILIFSMAALFMTACSDNSEKYGISSVYAANLQGEGTNENTVYICTGPNSTTAILTAEDWANALEKSRKSLSAKLNQWDALHANGVIDPQTKYKK